MRLRPFVVALLLAAGIAAQPGATAPSRDIDLVASAGFRSYSMEDDRWSQWRVGPDPASYPKRVFGSCGCLVTDLASILQWQFPRGFSAPTPWYTVTILDPTSGDSLQLPLEFNPVYVDKFLRYGPPGEPWTLDQGYQSSSDCGLMVAPWGLEHAASPLLIHVGDRFQPTGPTGISLDYHTGFDRALVDSRLDAGLPTIVYETSANVPGGAHAEIIVGWQSSPKPRYLIVDPLWSSNSAAAPPYTDDRAYALWESGISETVSYRVGSWPWLGILDDPSPISLLAVAPDGRRTGRDPDTGRVLDGPNSQVVEGSNWIDPLHAVPTGDPVRAVALREPEPGTWRFEVTGTGTGTAAYKLVDVARSGRENVLDSVDAPVAAGQTRKYEVEYQPAGQTSEHEVSDFRPEARIEAPSEGLTHTPLTFDGTGSFDVDGRVASWAWDFGDGTSANGGSVTHFFSAAGDHTVTLTVTDANGNTDTASQVVHLTPRDPDPPTTTAMVSPAIGPTGWTDAADATVLLSSDDGPSGSGVRSITWSAAGAQESSQTTVPGASAEIHVFAEGVTEITYAATDEDGNVEPAQTVDVPIDRGPPSSAVLTPAAGDSVSYLPFVAGSAKDDGSGPSSVEVSLRRAADGLYWNGSAWAGGEAWLPATGTKLWYWASPPAGSDLAPGGYTVRSRVTDGAGRVEEPGAGLTFTVAPRASSAYGVVPLQGSYPGFSQTRAQALNGSGGVAGYGFITESFLNRVALSWSGGTATGLAPLPIPAQGAVTRAINAAGDIAGWVFPSSGGGRPRATLWHDGTPVDLGTLDLGIWTSTAHSEALDLNDHGLAVGWSSNQTTLEREWTAVAWQDGHIRALPTLGGANAAAVAVNDLGTIVGMSTRSGYYGIDGVARATAWEPDGSIVDLGTLGGAGSTALDVNDAGQVVGWAEAADGTRHAFLWQDGLMSDLGPGVAVGINASGQVVGALEQPGTPPQPVLWDHGKTVLLNSLVDSSAPLEAPVPWDKLGRERGTPTLAIADDGTIAGSAIVGGLAKAVLVEPAAGGGDDVPPVTAAATAPAPNADGWVKRDATITLDATDTGGSGVKEIHHTGAPGPVAGGHAELTIADEGETRVEYYAVDNAGNTENPAKSVTVRVDKTPPTVALTAATPDGNAEGWRHSLVTLRLHADDGVPGSGVRAIHWLAEGAGAAPQTEQAGDSADVTVAADGETTVTFWAVDRADNESTRGRVGIRIDATPPSIVTTLDDDRLVAPGQYVSFSATDALSGLAAQRASLAGPDGTRTVDGDFVPGHPGSYVLHVEATDNAGNTTAVDRTFTVGAPPPPPVPVPFVPDNLPPIADAGGPVYDAVVGIPVRLDGTRSRDPEGAPLTYRWHLGDGSEAPGATPTHTFARAGDYVVALTVNDGLQDSRPFVGGHSFALVRVVANRPPDCSAVDATPATLWPPNHTLRTVQLSGVTDPDGDPITTTITSVTQDEPLNGLGDGDTTPDAWRTARPGEVLLRAERAGPGNGRVYRISYTAADGRGGECSGHAKVGVPHDQSGTGPVDSGLVVNSFGP